MPSRAPKPEAGYRPATSNQIVHPVYLDLPMVVSFVAAVEGGVAYGDRRTTTSGTSTDGEKSVGAKIGLPFISSLFQVGVAGDLKQRDQSELHEQVEVERQHTGASLFNLLRWKLRDELKLVTEVSTTNEIAQLSTGDLIEVRGRIESDPVLRIYDALEQVMTTIEHIAEVSVISSLLGQGLDLLVTQGQASDQNEGTTFLINALSAELDDTKAHSQPPAKQRPNKTVHMPSSQPPTKSRSAEAATEIVAQLVSLITRLREQALAAPVTDFALRVPHSNLRAVLTLSRSQLNDGAQLMVGGEFTVLGKITRIVKSDEEPIDLLRRSLFTYLPAETVEKVYQFIKGKPALKSLSIPELTIPGPALQILPIAVFT